MVGICRRPLLGHKQAAMLFLPMFSLVLSKTKGSVFDTPSEGEEERLTDRQLNTPLHMVEPAGIDSTSRPAS